MIRKKLSMKCPKCEHEFDDGYNDPGWTREDVAVAIGRNAAQTEFLNRFTRASKDNENKINGN